MYRNLAAALLLALSVPAVAGTVEADDLVEPLSCDGCSSVSSEAEGPASVAVHPVEALAVSYDQAAALPAVLPAASPVEPGAELYATPVPADEPSGTVVSEPGALGALLIGLISLLILRRATASSS